MAEEELSPNGGAAHSQRISVKEAVRRAHQFLTDLYDGHPLPNLRLEEVELTEDGNHWLVTLGFTGAEEEVEHSAFLQSVAGTTTRTRREYKVIRIDAYTGEPESMRIREI